MGCGSGVGAAAEFHDPVGLAVDSKSGTIFVADSTNHCIARIENKPAAGGGSGGEAVAHVSTLVGKEGTAEHHDGPAGVAALRSPIALALAHAAAGDVLYIACGDGVIRKYSMSSGQLYLPSSLPLRSVSCRL